MCYLCPKNENGTQLTIDQPQFSCVWSWGESYQAHWDDKWGSLFKLFVIPATTPYRKDVWGIQWEVMAKYDLLLCCEMQCRCGVLSSIVTIFLSPLPPSAVNMVNGITVNGLGEVALDQGSSLITLGIWHKFVYFTIIVFPVSKEMFHQFLHTSDILVNLQLTLLLVIFTFLVGSSSSIRGCVLMVQHTNSPTLNHPRYMKLG